MTRRIDRLLLDCRLATMTTGTADAYGAIDDCALLINRGRIIWAGARVDAPAVDAVAVARLDGRWVTPGLIDCHTHLLFGGNRAAEFGLLLEGATYADIARAGGGIASTVRATRSLDVDTLATLARPRLEALKRDGVTTIEIKSGYALDLEGELNMLRAARKLGTDDGIRVRTTYHGLHALPTEYAGRSDAYVDEVIGSILPAVAAEGLADAVNAYVEPLAFSVAQARRFVAAATAFGLRARMHADQLSDGGGTLLAAEIHALSADHVEYAGEAAIAALGASGVVAVLLPRGVSHPARNATTARRAVEATPSCDGGSDRLQSRHVTSDIALTGDESSLHAVRVDAGGSAGRCDAQRRARSGAARRTRHTRKRFNRLRQPVDAAEAFLGRADH